MITTRYFTRIAENGRRIGNDCTSTVMNYFLLCIQRCRRKIWRASGILALQNQPVLNLRGQGVLLGFIDTGIDYRNRCFLDNAGKSRILAIWDQTDQNGTPPEGIHYGSVYTKSEINGALSAEQPYETVPTRDISCGGTKLASIAAGSENRETGCGLEPRRCRPLPW